MAAASTMAAAVSGVILIAASALLCCLLAIPYLLLLWSLFSAVQRFDFVAAAGLVGAKMALRTLSLSSRYAGFYGLSGRIAQYGLHLMLVYLCCTELAVPVMPLAAAYLAGAAIQRYGAACCKATPRADGKLSVLLTGDSFFPKIDGIATFSEHAIKDIQKAGHSVHVMTSKDGPALLFGAAVTRVHGHIPALCPDHSIALPCWKAVTVLAELKPDVVHLFEAIPFNWFMAIVCHWLEVPYTCSLHTRIDIYGTVLSNGLIPLAVSSAFITFGYSAMLGTAKMLLPVCTPLKRIVERGGCRNVEIWRSGCAVEQFKPVNYSAAMRERLSRGRPDLPLVIHVGRIAIEKNADMIAKIINRWVELHGHDKVRFAVVGDGAQREEIEALCTPGAVLWTGFLSGVELWQAFASADVFFSGSATEALPLVYLEAMASGLAVCGPDAGGVPDTFTDGVQGGLFTSMDTESAVAALGRTVEIAAAKGRVDRIRKDAEQFTWTRSIAQLTECLVDAATFESRIKTK